MDMCRCGLILYWSVETFSDEYTEHQSGGFRLRREIPKRMATVQLVSVWFAGIMSQFEQNLCFGGMGIMKT